MTNKQGMSIRPIWLATSFLTAQVGLAASMGELVVNSGANEPFSASVPIVLPEESADVFARISQSEPAAQDVSIFVEQQKKGLYLIFMMASEPLPKLKNLTLEVEHNGKTFSRTYHLPAKGEVQPAKIDGFPTRITETRSNGPVQTVAKSRGINQRSTSRVDKSNVAVSAISKSRGYRIQQGDTLSEIALRFYPKVNQAKAMQWIAQHNSTLIAPKQLDKIYAGTILTLPKFERTPVVSDHIAIQASSTEKGLPKIESAVVAPKVSEPSPTPKLASNQTQVLAEKISEKQQQLEGVHERIRLLEQEIIKLSTQKTTTLPSQPPKPVMAHAAQNQTVAEHAFADFSESESLDQLVSDWLLTGIGGLAVMTLLAGLWVNRKRKAAQDRRGSGLIDQDSTFMGNTTMSMNGVTEVSLNDLLIEIDQKWQAKKWSQVESMLTALRNTYPDSPDLLIKLIELYGVMNKKEAMLMAKNDFVHQWGTGHPLYARVFGAQDGQDDAMPSFVKNLQQEAAVEFKINPTSN